ncbi:MAG: SDR family NAD(P)-dependent oxidoreductase [Magnetococcales bacterium]|nr:SDR family NAD(P)-dependent oxidoreductase [Magnetococcales bacterium]MBF0148988.1 SDR family NAD(P)-dependent oxidoreductase [Magnetococcales bacterium]MBF0603054.1 SDR family NAD(P)-dependent oxidoreductase [Magnetococcales bacterium]
MSLGRRIYFITGASGFIGRRLCTRLVAQGAEVRALVRSTEKVGSTLPGLILVAGDLGSPKTYASALSGSDVVIHLAGEAKFGNGPQFRQSNFLATTALLAAVKDQVPGLSRFVFVSTFGAVDRAPTDLCREPVDETYPSHPCTDYGRSKWEAEVAVRESSLPWCIVRPTPVVGAEMKLRSHLAVFVRSAMSGGLLSRFAFPGRFSFLHVDDLVEALILTSTHPEAVNRIFFAAGHPIALGQVFAWAAPNAVRVPLAWAADLLRPVMRWLPFQARALLYDALTASDAALQGLGWSPRHGPRESVEEVIQAERRRSDFYFPPAGLTLLTGAASGLGAALAVKLADMNRRLILVDKDEDGLAAMLSGHPAVVKRVVCDLSRDDELNRLLTSPIWGGEGIDEVFACAGFGARGPVTQLNGITQVNIFLVNLVSRVRLCHHAALVMTSRSFGRIVLISSSSAYQALPYMAAYAASNAALLSFGEALWGEMEGSGVEVLTVCPGGMSTRFQERAGVLVLPNERLDTPETVADAILLAVKRKQGPVLKVGIRSKGMDFIARLLPRRMRVRLWKRLMGMLR